MKQTKKIERNPVVMIVAGLMLVMSIVIAALGIIYFTSLGWWVAGAMIIGGLGSVSLSIMSLVTGKPEWILLDLILPG